MKRLILLVLVGFLLTQCSKPELPRDKYLGTWNATNIENGIEQKATISAHKNDNKIVWEISYNSFCLEIDQEDEFKAHYFTPVGILVDTEARMEFISQDTIMASFKKRILRKHIPRKTYMLVRED